MYRPKGIIGLLAAATLTTLLAVLIAQGVAKVVLTDEAFGLMWDRIPVIVVLTAFPLCYFVWNIARKNYEMSLELQRLVDRDRLTDLATRDYFFARMQREPAIFGTAMMVDIDHFKQVNDNFGHFAGDHVIKAVASHLHRAVRSEDIVCRFGGEEFMIFLSGRTLNEAFIVAERMRGDIEKDNVQFFGQRIKVTVSIGGAIKAELEDISSAINAADAALYRAKNAGRNRIVFRGGPDKQVTPIA